MKNYALDKHELVSTKGLTLAQLIKNTEKMRKYRSDDIVIKGIKKGKTKNGRAVIHAIMSSGSDKTKSYQTWITIMTEGQNRIPPNQKVQVQCSCDDYIFTWEYANAAHRAARIFFGTGEAPDFKNPGLEYGLCKHLYALAHHLLPSAK